MDYYEMHHIVCSCPKVGRMEVQVGKTGVGKHAIVYITHQVA